MFKQPFFISPHAVNRFRERVADLPAKTIIIIVQAALQDNHQPIIVQVFNHKPTPVFRARYQDIEYLIPVTPKSRHKDGWPEVPTILKPCMRLGKVIGERRGWNWQS